MQLDPKKDANDSILTNKWYTRARVPKSITVETINYNNISQNCKTEYYLFVWASNLDYDLEQHFIAPW